MASTMTTFDISFDIGLGGFIGGWTFVNERLQYWNSKNK